MADGLMQIGEVAEHTSLSLRTLRHYDDVGLLTPSARSEGGFRLYTPLDVDRLQLIKRMKPLGYTLEQMRELLEVIDALDAAPADREADAALERLVDEAVRRKEELARQVAMAEEFVTQLTRRRARVG